MFATKFFTNEKRPALTPRQKVGALAALLVIYTTIVLLTEHEFSLIGFSVVLNLFLLPQFLQQQSAYRIDNPNDYVRFDETMMHIGDTAIALTKINKVALDVVKNDCYFSLPYNPTSPGNCPAFVFPANQYDRFKRYIEANLHHVEIIR